MYLAALAVLLCYACCQVVRWEGVSRLVRVIGRKAFSGQDLPLQVCVKEPVFKDVT